jgi:hypothetical protein
VRPIYRTGPPLPSRCCILYIIFSTIISTEYFKHAAQSPFFSSKCHLFHNATFFGFCLIHILHTGVLKFKCKIPVPKGETVPHAAQYVPHVLTSRNCTFHNSICFFWYSQQTVIISLILTFMGPCIANIFQYVSNKMQLYTVYLYLETALHVSGVTSNHHQERINCIYSIWCLSHRYCYLPL